MPFVQKTIFMITNGAFYSEVFIVDKAILNIYFYGMLNLVPMAALFFYFGFIKASFVVFGILVALYAFVFWLIRPNM